MFFLLEFFKIFCFDDLTAVDNSQLFFDCLLDDFGFDFFGKLFAQFRVNFVNHDGGDFNDFFFRQGQIVSDAGCDDKVILVSSAADISSGSGNKA